MAGVEGCAAVAVGDAAVGSGFKVRGKISNAGKVHWRPQDALKDLFVRIVERQVTDWNELCRMFSGAKVDSWVFGISTL